MPKIVAETSCNGARRATNTNTAGVANHLDRMCIYSARLRQQGGLFGLSHDELLQSEWVHDDVLTLKFVLEVRPCREYSSQVVAREVVGVPEPTLCRDPKP